MTDHIASRTKLITGQRDEAIKEAEKWKKEALDLQNELAHLRHFSKAVERGLRNLPGASK